MPGRKSLIYHVLLLISFILITSCKLNTDPVAAEDILEITINNSQTYEYTISANSVGDEDGMFILNQAKHFQVSEILRDATTNYLPLYRYQPKPGFSGNDTVIIQEETGSDGAGPPADIRRTRINFIVK